MMYYYFGEVTGESEKRGELEVTNFLVEWKVPDFPPIQTEYNVSSPEFEYLGAKWCIDLYTKDEFWELCIHQKEEKPSNIWAYYIIGIKEIDGTVYKSESGRQKVGAVDDSGSTQEFLRPSDLQQDKMRITPEGVLVVFCSLSLKEKCERQLANATIQTEISERVEKLVHDFKNLLLSGEETDMILKVKGQDYKVHKAVLVARSTVFSAMMKSDMKEKSSGVVQIDDCDPEAFQQFLTYLYSGDLGIFSTDTVFALYSIAEKYDAQEFKKPCVQFITDNLSVETFCDVLSLSIKHDESELLEKAVEFFAQNMLNILVTTKWLSFVKENPVEANELHIKSAKYPAKRD